MEAQTTSKIYSALQKKYLLVYLLAAFADWLQGPYLYRLYMNYGYSRGDISLMYIMGFASGMTAGLLIGHLADTFGRKKLCIVYSFTTSVTCLIMSTSNNYIYLLVARMFGGASTSILFSIYDSWYVSQHLQTYKLDDKLLSDTFIKSTLYNGVLAIGAGFFASLLADEFELGPTAPFLLAIPISLLSGYFCCKLWQENDALVPENSTVLSNTKRSLNLLLFTNKNWLLLSLGASQVFFETVMYLFIFLWTPVLHPLKISEGLVFGTFMLCTMLGSVLSSFLISKFVIKRERLLSLSIGIGATSIFCTTLGVYFQESKEYKNLGNFICLFSFFVFELSVGIYYPSIGYLRGVVVPESYRASITNWFRLPMNSFLCFSLLYITVQVPKNSCLFAFCSFALVMAFISSLKFAKLFARNIEYTKLSETLLL